MENKDDRYYIEKVLAGDPAAYAHLVEKYKVMAYNISLKIVRRPEDAEEITQDSFVKAYRSLKGYKGDARFSTWLYRIVYNTSVSYLRSNRKRGWLDGGRIDRIRDDGPAEEADNHNDEMMAAALKRATESLPSEEQTMIMLYYYDDRSIEEIAGVMNLSASNVKVRLFRIRKKLHDMVSVISNSLLQED